MEELINQLSNVTGIDRTTAEKVVKFLKDKPQEAPKLMGILKDSLPAGIASKLPSNLGDLFDEKK